MQQKRLESKKRLQQDATAAAPPKPVAKDFRQVSQGTYQSDTEIKVASFNTTRMRYTQLVIVEMAV